MHIRLFKHFFFIGLKSEEVRAIMFHCIVEIKSPCPLQQQDPQGGLYPSSSPQRGPCWPPIWCPETEHATLSPCPPPRASKSTASAALTWSCLTWFRRNRTHNEILDSLLSVQIQFIKTSCRWGYIDAVECLCCGARSEYDNPVNQLFSVCQIQLKIPLKSAF